jgi:DNA-binding response OmpR family regulator
MMTSTAYIRDIFVDHPAEAVLTFGTLTLDPHLGTFSVGSGPSVPLMVMETKLLAALILAPRGLLTHAAAFDALYRDRGDKKEPLVGGLCARLSYLRKKLKANGFGIVNSRGRGWQLQALS